MFLIIIALSLVLLGSVFYIINLYQSRRFVIDQSMYLIKELRDTKNERDILYKKLPAATIPSQHGYYVIQQPAQTVIGRCLTYGDGWVIFDSQGKTEKHTKREIEYQAALHQWDFKPIHLVKTSLQESGDYRYVSKRDCYDHTDGLLIILQNVLSQIPKDGRQQIAAAVSTTKENIWEAMCLVLWNTGILSDFAIECMCRTTFFTDEFIDPIIDRFLRAKTVLGVEYACRLLKEYPHRVHLPLLMELVKGGWATSDKDRITATIDLLQRKDA